MTDLSIPEDTRITLPPLTLDEAENLRHLISWVKHSEAGCWWYPRSLDSLLARLERELFTEDDE